MIKRCLSLIAAVLFCIAATAQTVTLTFSGRDAQNHYVQLDRVSVTNLTQGWQETLVWPDTILTLQCSDGIREHDVTKAPTGLQLSQNNPNPFNGTTEVFLTVADAGRVVLEIADTKGQLVETQNFATLQSGAHQFRIAISAPGIYFLTARQNGQSSSIKMVCNNGAGNGNKVEYTGIVETPYFDASATRSVLRGVSDNPFSLGDQMEYTGYATISGNACESHTITHAQQGSESFRLQFDATLPAPVDGQPCPSTPTLTDIDGNVYNTVQLGGQCWMKENLRTTRFANSAPITLGTDHSSSEKLYYYPNNDEANAESYGLLYNWAAVMNGEAPSASVPSGLQGVCPDGWHVPSAAEWGALISYMGGRSQYLCGGESANIAKALASTSGWNNGTMECAVGNGQSANNASRFTGMPTGGFVSSGIANFGKYAMYWSCTGNSTEAEAYYLGYNAAAVGHPASGYSTTYGMGVRCVRDEGNGGSSDSDASDLNSCPASAPNANETGSNGRITELRDYDNNSYRVVRIGTQCWMKDNLRTKHYADGTTIAQGSNSMFSLTTSTSYYFYPDGNASNASTYGLLYNWKAAIRNLSSATAANPSGVQGVCPNGWHLPSEAEYAQMTDYVQNQSEYACNPTYSNYVASAFAANECWGSSSIECAPGYNLAANNATGFNAIPAGQWAQDPSGINQYASFWGASGDSSTAYSWNLMMNHPYPIVSYDMSEWAYSVRCVRN